VSSWCIVLRECERSTAVIFPILKYIPCPLLCPHVPPQDNVKYLYNLDRFSQPLYRSNPVEMVDAVPGMIKAIRQMHSLARYYNTSERMTALFVKVTNQMIVCCKNYLLHKGPLWTQDRPTLIKRLHACIDLRDTYREHYRRTKACMRGRAVMVGWWLMSSVASWPWYVFLAVVGNINAEIAARRCVS